MGFVASCFLIWSLLFMEKFILIIILFLLLFFVLFLVRSHLACAANEVNTSLATEWTQRQREGLRAWSCVDEFATSTNHVIISATKRAMSTSPVPCTRLRCVLIFWLNFLYQDKKWKKKMSYKTHIAQASRCKT